MKKIAIIILILCSTCFGKILRSKSQGFDAFETIKNRKTASSFDQAEIALSIGTAEGQMLYWNNTTKKWTATDVTKLKWTAASDTLLADTLTTSLITGADVDITGGTGTWSTTGTLDSGTHTIGDLVIGDGTIVDNTGIAFSNTNFTGVGAIGCASVTATGDISAGGNIGIGEAASANERLNILMSASDTVGIQVDGFTNDFVYAGAAIAGVNNFLRDIGGTSSIIAPVQVHRFRIDWSAIIDDRPADYALATLENVSAVLSMTGTFTANGPGAGSTTKTYDMMSGNFLTQYTGDFVGSSTSANQIWNPRSIGLKCFSVFSPETITTTDGHVLYQGIAGVFEANPGVGSITHNFSANDETQSIEWIGGLLCAEGLSSIANLPSTSYGIKVSATNSDTNIAIKVLAGTSELLDTNIGDGTNEMQVSGTGDTYWAGTGGLLFGNMDQENATSFTVTLTNQNDWYELDHATTGIVAGELNDVTFDGDHYLKGRTAGKYFIIYSVVCSINDTNQHIEFQILKNGSVTGKGESHTTFIASSRDLPCGSSTILDLAVDDEISIAARNVTVAGKIITIDHLEMTIFMVGGT